MVNFHEFDAMTAPTPNPSQEGNYQDADERLLPSRERVVVRFMEGPLAIFALHWDHEPRMHNWFICKGDILRFMESRLSIFRMGWDPELLNDARQRESADKSDALQTLRASGRVTGRRVSVWSAYARR